MSLKILKCLYENEINWRLSCFWDGGYRIELGDEINGFQIGAQGFETINEAIEWLFKEACTLYPELNGRYFALNRR